ncbi:OmpA family protein [Burkholderia ambifaria]|uniref:OmpA family protein n=1 Tax=Burkholderia ambifaria TaxID=152480 RepID=UPI00158B14A4|nr:OmpA family protein [Burkholderia ambifaria]
MKAINLLLALGAASVLAGCLSSGPTFTARSVARVDGPAAYEVTCYGIFEGRNTCFTKAKEICDKYAKGKPVYSLEDYAPLGSRTQGKPDTNALVFQCGAPAEPPKPVAQPVVQTPAPAPVVMPPQKVSLGGDALFDTNKATLRPAGQEKLDKLLEEANAMKFDRVTVDGYTDSRGSAARNQALSQRRAQTVAGYLKSHGLDAPEYVVKGHGAANPVASNATAQGRALNRRVELTLEGLR